MKPEPAILLGADVRRLIAEVIDSVIPSFYAETAAACVADALHGAGYALIKSPSEEIANV